jgi:hypothetical protein
MSMPAKKWDLPDPRPPHAPLYRDGASKGSKTSAVSISRTDNAPLDQMNEVDGIAIVIPDNRLRNLAIEPVGNLFYRWDFAQFEQLAGIPAQ